MSRLSSDNWLSIMNTVVIFLCHMILLRWLTLLLRFLTVILSVLSPLDLFLYCEPTFSFAVAFTLQKNSGYATISVSIDFTSNSNGNAHFHRTAFTAFLNFVNESRLELIQIFLVANIGSPLIHLHDFQLLVQLPSS